MLPGPPGGGLQRSLQVQGVDGAHRRCQQQDRRQAHRGDHRHQRPRAIGQGLPRLLGPQERPPGGDRHRDGRLLALPHRNAVHPEANSVDRREDRRARPGPAHGGELEHKILRLECLDKEQKSASGDSDSECGEAGGVPQADPHVQPSGVDHDRREEVRGAGLHHEAHLLRGQV